MDRGRIFEFCPNPRCKSTERRIMMMAPYKNHYAAVARMKKVEFEDHDFKKSQSSAVFSPICVEVARKDGIVAVRDSKDTSIKPLLFSNDEWTAFVAGVKNGEFEV